MREHAVGKVNGSDSRAARIVGQVVPRADADFKDVSLRLRPQLLAPHFEHTRAAGLDCIIEARNTVIPGFGLVRRRVIITLCMVVSLAAWIALLN